MNNITQFLMSHGGPVLFAIVLAEQAGLPLPAAPWLLAAGALAAGGTLNPVLAVTLTALACVAADLVWYYVGRRGGRRVLRLFCRLSLSPNSCVGGSKNLFARHGAQGLVAAKFIPVLGGVMPPLAGALGMSAIRFLVFDGLGSILYGSVYITAGFVFHNQLHQMGALLNQLGFSALLLIGVLVPAYIGFKIIRRRRATVERALRGSSAYVKTQAAEELVTAKDGAGVPSSVPLPGERLEPLAFPNSALALMSAQSELRTPNSALK